MKTAPVIQTRNNQDDNIFLGYEELFSMIEELLNKKEIATISIDGMCGSGKTYLAEIIKNQFCCNVYHADSFFLQQHQRTPQRLAEIGGNLDFERLKIEVLDRIAENKTFEYNHFSCQTLTLSERIISSPNRLHVIEGSFSQNPRLAFDFDLKIFVCTSNDIQEKRILQRNGQEKLQQFKTLWIPKENAYFEEFGIKEKCDVIICT